MSWVMFEHVAYRISYDMLEEMLREFFGLAVCGPEIHMIKSLMAQYYQPGYKRLLDKILSGPVLHIDETQVTLKTGKGYVWVFASLEDVVFLYRPTPHETTKEACCIAGRNCGESLLGPRLTVADVKKWLPVWQVTVSFTQDWALSFRPARLKK